MKQHRNTKQRQLILDIVKSRRDHPTASQICENVQAIDKNISRGTVYRNLNFLVENKEILKVKLLNIDRFDYPLKSHYHLICTECGDVQDVPLSYKTELDQELAAKTGYTIMKHHTVFEGLCSECKNKES